MFRFAVVSLIYVVVVFDGLGQYNGRGVPVDYPVQPSIDDILSGRDAPLELIYKLIE